MVKLWKVGDSMSYYKEKRIYFLTIQEYIKNHQIVDFNTLEYISISKYGYSKLALNKVLKILEDREQIKIKDNIINWVG